MFASFKGTPRDKLKEEVESMIQTVGLTEKRKAYSKTLSGGQKRKLSVAIAFIGGSRVVFLDGKARIISILNTNIFAIDANCLSFFLFFPHTINTFCVTSEPTSGKHVTLN